MISFKILLIERAVGFLPPAHTPRYSITEVCSEFFDILRRALAARLYFLQFGYRISFDFPRGIVYHIG